MMPKRYASATDGQGPGLSLPDGILMPDKIIGVALITDRPGSRVWKVTMAGGDVVAVKYTTGSEGHAGRFAAREAAILTHVDPDNLFAFGTTDHGTWLAVEWDDAPTLAHQWQHAETDRRTAVTAATQAAATLADLHTAGWRHADLQGPHILCPPAGPARLIDWALGQGPADDLPAIPYRGGYAHLTAPEIAAELLDTPSDHNVTMTTAAEVYTFGATLFASWTKQWPRDYGSSDPSTLSAPDIYTAITQRDTLRPMPERWSTMAALIAAMLDQHASNRPTMADVHEVLTHDIERSA